MGVVAAALALAAPAAASAATAGQVSGLAREARDDPAALRRLVAITVVDGRRVDLRAALARARGRELRARLRALEDQGAGAPTRDATSDARAILSQRRFHERHLPRPLKKPLEWLADRLRPVGHALRDAFAAIAGRLPGGSATLWTLIAAVVVALAAFSASRLASRRARAIEHEAARRRAAGDAANDPRALEREAVRAEREADYERAVRLRFRAGLLRLDIEPSTTSGAAARRLRSPAFDTLAERFDAIAYGHRPAGAEDAAAAREGWRAVLAEATR